MIITNIITSYPALDPASSYSQALESPIAFEHARHEYWVVYWVMFTAVAWSRRLPITQPAMICFESCFNDTMRNTPIRLYVVLDENQRASHCNLQTGISYNACTGCKKIPPTKFAPT